MDIKKLYLYELWDTFIKNVHGTSDTALWLIMIQIMLGIFLPLMALYKLLYRKSTVEKVICCMIPFVLIGTVSIMEGIIFGFFCSKEYQLGARLVLFLHNRRFFRESLALCVLFLLCSVLFTVLSRRTADTSVIHLLLNQIVEYVIVGIVIWFGYDYLVKNGNAFFETSDAFIKWYIYGLWILFRQSAFYLLCIVCFLVFYERRAKFVNENYVSSGDWLACYLSDNYRGPGISITLYGLLFCLISTALFKEGRYIRESYYMGFVIAAVAAVITLVGFLMLFFAVFPKLLGSYKMIDKSLNTERMIAQIYRELEQEKPLVKFEFGRGFITKNFIVLYLPMRIYYIPFYQSRKGSRFYFSDGRKFFIHECDAGAVRSHVERGHGKSKSAAEDTYV